MKLEQKDDVGILYIDTERNNSFNLDSIRESHQLMDEAENDETIRALVVMLNHVFGGHVADRILLGGKLYICTKFAF